MMDVAGVTDELPAQPWGAQPFRPIGPASGEVIPKPPQRDPPKPPVLEMPAKPPPPSRPPPKLPAGVAPAKQPAAKQQPVAPKQQPARAPPKQPPKPPEPVGWACPSCTFVNVPTRPGCELCSAERPADYQVPQEALQNLPPAERRRLELEREAEAAAKAVRACSKFSI